MPLPYRWLTSLMMRYNGKSILIDCGEGTQIAMKEKGWSPKPIDVICFTHYHADHISGLPGMLLTMGNAERTEPLLLIGPKGLTKVVNSLRVIAPELPFAINCLELTEAEQTVAFDGFRIENGAGPVFHLESFLFQKFHDGSLPHVILACDAAQSDFCLFLCCHVSVFPLFDVHRLVGPAALKSVFCPSASVRAKSRSTRRRGGDYSNSLRKIRSTS